jgi:hypothetical protein
MVGRPLARPPRPLDFGRKLEVGSRDLFTWSEVVSRATNEREPSTKRHQTPVQQRLSPKMRSALTNGSRTLPGDCRTALARRYYDVCAAIVADQGGAEALSEARLQLVRRFAGAAVLSETMEAAVAEGKVINLAEYAALISSMCRVGTRIGIDRKMKNITPSLAEYMNMKASEPAEADE